MVFDFRPTSSPSPSSAQGEVGAGAGDLLQAEHDRMLKGGGGATVVSQVDWVTTNRHTGEARPVIHHTLSTLLVQDHAKLVIEKTILLEQQALKRVLN